MSSSYLFFWGPVALSPPPTPTPYHTHTHTHIFLFSLNLLSFCCKQHCLCHNNKLTFFFILNLSHCCSTPSEQISHLQTLCYGGRTCWWEMIGEITTRRQELPTQTCTHIYWNTVLKSAAISVFVGVFLCPLHCVSTLTLLCVISRRGKKKKKHRKLALVRVWERNNTTKILKQL